MTEFILHPYFPEFVHLYDQFMIDGVRVRIGGGTIDVECDDPKVARSIATRYFEIVRRYLPDVFIAKILTLDELAALPAAVVGWRPQSLRPEPGWKDRIRGAVRDARNEALAGADATLQRAYDYLQDAREKAKGQLADLYKVVETIENALGGEQRAGTILRVSAEPKVPNRRSLSAAVLFSLPCFMASHSSLYWCLLAEANLGHAIALWLGLALLLLGVAIMIPGRRVLHAAGTNVDPPLPPTTIGRFGPFCFSRNLLYVGLTLLYLGLTLAFNTWWGVLLLVPILIIMHRGVVFREERHLEQKLVTPSAWVLRYDDVIVAPFAIGAAGGAHK